MDYGSGCNCLIRLTGRHVKSPVPDGYLRARSGLILKARPPRSQELDNVYDPVFKKSRRLGETEREGIAAVDPEDFYAALESRDPCVAEWLRQEMGSFPVIGFIFFPDEFVAD